MVQSNDAVMELEVSIVEDHHEFRDVPQWCPNCRADLTEAGAVDQFMYIPARRRGKLVVDSKTNEASFVEDTEQNRWNQTDDLDFCPVTHYSCSSCDWVISAPIECTC